MNTDRLNILLAWVLSVLLHLLVILAIIYKSPSISSESADHLQSMVNRPIFADILPAPAVSEVKEQSDISIESVYPVDDKMCGNKSASYIGVGIMYSYSTNLINYAPEYYPGFKSGIRVGDRLLNPEAIVDKDGFMTLMVLRSGQELVFKVRAEKICVTG